jgi:hypothetical protein
MKKRPFAFVIPLVLLAGSLPLAACASNSSSSVSQTTSEESVTPGETSISLTGGDRGVVVGGSMPLRCIVYGPNAKVSYSSSDTSIATVDEEGVVTGIKPGFVTIRATSAASSDVSAAYTLFIEPSYISSMVKSFRNNNYASGLSFAGRLGFMVSPASASSTEEKSTTYAPFTFAVQNTTHQSSSGSGSYLLPSFDLRAEPDKSVSSLVSMILGKGSYKAKNFSVASLDLNSPIFYSEENTDQGLFGLYQQFSFLEKVASLLPSASTLLENYSSVSGAVTDFSGFLDKEAATLNDSLAFSDDGTEGIYLKDSVIAKINEKWPSVITSIKNSTTMNSTLKAILPGILPESFSDIRFSVSTNSGEYAGLSFRISGKKKSGSPKVDTEYHPLTITLQTPTALATDYFSTLKSRFSVADNDVVLLDKVETAEASLYAIYSSYNQDVYNTLNFSKKFERLLKKYNANSYPLLSQIVNTPLIPVKHTSDGSTLDFHYGPYEAYTLSKQNDAQGNVIADDYAPNAGDSFTLSAIKPFGNSETAFATAPTFSYTLSGDDSIVASDYVSLDSNVLTIKKLPTDSRLTLTLTPSAVDGYVPVAFTMYLNKVSA